MFAVELLIHENLIENSKSLKCWNEGASPQKMGLWISQDTGNSHF